jgi:GTPase SAR1 family protein
MFPLTLSLVDRSLFLRTSTVFASQCAARRHQSSGHTKHNDDDNNQQQHLDLDTMANRATGAAKPPLYKIVMLGDSGVGKSSIVCRLTNPDRPLNHDISATMGIEFDTQMLDTAHGKVKAQIWDTAGQERFARVLLPTYFRFVNCCVYCIRDD